MVPKQRIFLDTNIIIYSFDNHNPQKKEAAVKAMNSIFTSGQLPYISPQIIKETYTNLIKKLKFIPSAAREVVTDYFDWNLVADDINVIRKTFSIQWTTSFSIWDSSIIAAAIAGGCNELWTEDLHSGQVIEGLKIVNPLL